MGVGRYSRVLGVCIALLTASGAGAVELGDDSFVVTADSLVYDAASRQVFARGDVEITRDERRLLADEVRYRQDTDVVSARGNVILIEPSGDTVFADEIEITGDLREGFIENVRILMTDDARIAAARGERTEGNTTEMEKVVYSPCPVCEESEDPPLWQLSAESVTHDQESRDLIYRDAYFEVAGVPVAYLPYIRHPDPTVKKRSGFLAPTFGRDSELGLTAEIPYFWNIAPNRDLTIAPIFTSDEGVVLRLDGRDLQTFGRTDLGGSITYTTEFEGGEDASNTGKEWRGHLEGDGRYSVGGPWDGGFDLLLATDDTYLKRYDFNDDDILRNRVFVRRIEEQDYFSAAGHYFQGLRDDDRQGEIPVAAPFIESEIVSDPLLLGSRLKLDSSALALTRDSGLDTRRASVSGSWELPYFGPIGDVWHLSAGLRGDVYNTQGDPQTLGTKGGGKVTGRLIPSARAVWSLPLARVGESWTQTVEPVVATTFLPGDLNKNQIPNEDSIEVEYDDTNLFSASRFPGIDKVEQGGHAAYGVRVGGYGPFGERITGLFGQSYRLYGGNSFEKGTGLENSLSDYVGRINFAPADYFDVTYRFRLDKSDLDDTFTDVSARIGPDWLRVDIGYLKQSAIKDVPNLDAQEQLTAGVHLDLDQAWSFDYRVRQDLENDRLISQSFGVTYTHPCLEVTAGVVRKNTQDRDLEDTTTFSVRIALKTLGSFGGGGQVLGGG